MRKNSIQNQAKQAENQILEENTQFYDKVKAKYFPKQAANNRILFLRIGSVAAVAVVLVICLSIILTKVLDDNQSGKNYLLQNEESTMSDLAELNANLNNVLVDIDENEYEFQISRVYDSESGDNLYFIINVTGVDYFENIKIYLFINPYYEKFREISGERIENTKIGGFEVSYRENVLEDSDGIFELNYVAQLYDGNSGIYIEYEQIWYENSTNFFNFLEKTIKSK